MFATRKTWSILVLLGGAGSLVFGSRFHAQTVYQDREREVTVATSRPFGFQNPPAAQPESTDVPPPSDDKPDRGDKRPANEANPFDTPAAGPDKSENPFDTPAKTETEQNPFATPVTADAHAPAALPAGMRLETVVEKYVDVRCEPEWVLVREITYGGLERLASGDLKRTYSGRPPSLCPT